jgi:hypothetical protein
LQLLPLPGSAQAKIEDVSRLFLNHVSQMPMNVPMIQVVIHTLYLSVVFYIDVVKASMVNVANPPCILELCMT